MSQCPNRPSVELKLIPDFELRCGGDLVTLTPATRRLVAFLALHARPVLRARASAELWLDVDPRHAAASLRSALWRLPARDIVGSSSSHVWLDPGVEVDLRRISQGTLLVLNSTPSEETLLALAHELIDVGDDVLTGWPDDWVDVERERFRQLRLQAMDRISEELVGCGRCLDALQVALAASSAEPLRESSHRVVMKVHLRQGNVSEAIREYRKYAELLRVELDGRPSQIMNDLLAPFVRRALA